MGFPSFCYCVVLPRHLLVLVQILVHMRLLLSTILHYLGFQDLPGRPTSSPPAPSDERILVHDLLAPASIKRSLPVVRFAAFPKGPACREEDASSAGPTCAICLCAVEGWHDVRVLGNCCHAFHRGCIDRWLDLGQLTCPLCRSWLVPAAAVVAGDDDGGASLPHP